MEVNNWQQKELERKFWETVVEEINNQIIL
jgi:hypothetical protein